MPLSCKNIVEQSTEYLEENANWASRLKIRFHLLMCHHCRRFIRHKKIANEYVLKQQQLQQFSDQQLEQKIDSIMMQIKQNSSQ